MVSLCSSVIWNEVLGSFIWTCLWELQLLSLSLIKWYEVLFRCFSLLSCYVVQFSDISAAVWAPKWFKWKSNAKCWCWSSKFTFCLRFWRLSLHSFEYPNAFKEIMYICVLTHVVQIFLFCFVFHHGKSGLYHIYCRQKL